jgi:hypothetical protein
LIGGERAVYVFQREQDPHTANPAPSEG